MATFTEQRPGRGARVPGTAGRVARGTARESAAAAWGTTTARDGARGDAAIRAGTLIKEEGTVWRDAVARGGAAARGAGPKPRTVRNRPVRPKAVERGETGLQAGSEQVDSGHAGAGRDRAPQPGSDPAPTRPAVILRLPPPLDPPFDDQATNEPRPVVTKPALGMEPLPLEWPGTPQPVRPAAREHRPAASQTLSVRSSSYKAAKHFASLCVEVLNGYRPPNQLRALTHPQRFGEISDQLLRRTVRIRMNPGQAARNGTLVRIRRLLVTEPLDGVAEGVVVLEHGLSTWAMAVRFEKADRPNFGVLGWWCTLVQVL